MATVATVKWIDLQDASVSLRVGMLQRDDGTSQTLLYILGLSPISSRWTDAIEKLGFVPSPNRKYLARVQGRDAAKITAREFQTVWPHAILRDLPRDRVILDLQGARKSRQEQGEQRGRSGEEREVAQETGVRFRLGRNAAGDEVFAGPLGRYLIQANGQRLDESKGLNPGLFLRVEGVDGLDLCADGFVVGMASGEVQRDEELTAFMAAVYDRPLPVTDDSSAAGGSPFEFTVQEYAQVQSAIDAALVRHLAASSETAQDAYGRAERLYAYLPRFKDLSGRGLAAMPLPLAVISQRLLGDTSGKKVVIPNAWDAACLTFLPPGTRIHAFVGDRDLSRTVRSIRTEDVVWEDRFDALNQEANGLIFNVDPGISSADGRLDHRRAFDAIDCLTAGGRAVLVLAVNNANRADDEQFLSVLLRRFHVELAVELGRELTYQVGTDASLRLISLSNRPPDEFSLRSGYVAPVVHSWDELKTHVDEAIVRNQVNEPVIESIDVRSVVEENEFQRPYVAFSRSGSARTMVPKNLQGPLQHALAIVEQAHGSVDELVRTELGMQGQTLADRFSPEQIDALALGLHRMMTLNRGLIIGDETGIGKGRILSGLATWANKCGKDVIFVTDRANLFSDFLRDMRDIEEWGRMNPLLMNADAKLVDMFTGEHLADGVSHSAMSKILREQTNLRQLGVNFVFTTYSQISGEDSPKAEWLLNQMSNSLLIVDEAHVAAGSDSNISRVIVEMTRAAWQVCYSSATWAKSSENLHVYGRAFPDSINVSSLSQTMRTGGEAFSEVFSSMLARDGAFIRREHDLSKIDFRLEVDVARRERNERFSDQIAAVLASMTFVSGELQKMVTRLNMDTVNRLKAAKAALEASKKPPEAEAGAEGGEDAQRITQANPGPNHEAVPPNGVPALDTAQQIGKARLFKTSFGGGSVLYQVMRRTLAILNADHVADLALAAIEANCKPVIVFEDTGEAFLRRAIQRETIRGLDGELDTQPSDVQPPRLKDLLKHVMKRLGVIHIEEHDGVTLATSSAAARAALSASTAGDEVDLEHVLAQEGASEASTTLITIRQLPGVTQDQQDAFQTGIQEIMRLIDELPDFPLSAVDVMQARLRAQGLNLGEISGRTMQLLAPEAVSDAPIDSPELGLSRWVLHKRDKRKSTVNKTVAEFNRGDLDALFINRSGATGISVHASPRFKDVRRRVLIESQIPANPNDRLQLFGRVNRFDQLVPPMIQIAATGIYGEVRELMQQNLKLSRLSANVRSSRGHVAEIKAVPDLLNKVGREVAMLFLEDNPGLRSRLCIGEADMQRQGFDFIGRLTSRIALLPVKEQRVVYEELTELYEDVLARYEMDGGNPLKPKELDLRAKTTESEVVLGIDMDGLGSAFDGPVYLKGIAWKRTVDPIPAVDILMQVQESRKRLCEENWLSWGQRNELTQTWLDDERLAGEFRSIQERALPVNVWSQEVFDLLGPAPDSATEPIPGESNSRETGFDCSTLLESMQALGQLSSVRSDKESDVDAFPVFVQPGVNDQARLFPDTTEVVDESSQHRGGAQTIRDQIKALRPVNASKLYDKVLQIFEAKLAMELAATPYSNTEEAVKGLDGAGIRLGLARLNWLRSNLKSIRPGALLKLKQSGKGSWRGESTLVVTDVVRVPLKTGVLNPC